MYEVDVYSYVRLAVMNYILACTNGKVRPLDTLEFAKPTRYEGYIAGANQRWSDTQP